MNVLSVCWPLTKFGLTWRGPAQNIFVRCDQSLGTMRPNRMCLCFLLSILWAVGTDGTYSWTNSETFPGASMDLQEILDHVSDLL